MPEPFLFRDALHPAMRAAIHSLLIETAQRRPLSRLEIRLRCITQPSLWREAGCDRSTWYRRKKRQQVAGQMAQAA